MKNRAKAFSGPVYSPENDFERLRGQIRRVFNLMRDSRWRTLNEVSRATGDPESSISAQLRHLRKPHWGLHLIDKRLRGSPKNGLWEYRLVVNYGQLKMEI